MLFLLADTASALIRRSPDYFGETIFLLKFFGGIALMFLAGYLVGRILKLDYSLLNLHKKIKK